ncbi:MAG: hypothetical protein ABIA17_02655 [Elusimicrobiota bacterium]
MRKLIALFIFSVVFSATNVVSSESSSVSNSPQEGYQEIIDEINAMIPYYQTKCKEFKRDIDELKESERVVALSAIEKRLGVVLFLRSKDKMVFPSSRPLPEERISKDTVIKAWSCRNQTRSFTVECYCIKPLSKLEAKLSELKLEGGGGIIGSEKICAYSIIPVPIRWSRPFRQDGRPEGPWYEWLPAFMAENTPVAVPLKAYREVEQKEEYAQRFLFQVRVSSVQKPGFYSGKITVSVDDSIIQEIPVCFEVLLPVLDDCNDWLRAFFEGGNPGLDGYSMIKDYGFNTVALWADTVYQGWGKGASYGWYRFDSRLKEIEKSGLWPKRNMPWVYFLQERCFGNRVANWGGTQQYPSEEYKTEYVKRLKEIYDRCKEKGWGLPIIVTNDESSDVSKWGEGMVDCMFDLSELVKKNIPGSKTYCTIFQAGDWKRFYEHPKAKAIDYWVSNNCCPYGAKMLTSISGVFGEYRGSHMLRKPGNMRFDIGCRSFLYNAKYSFRWGNLWWVTLETLNAEEKYGYVLNTVQYRLKKSKRMIPAWALDSLREGIDDRRTFETLSVLAQESSDVDKKKVNELLEKIKLETLKNINPAGLTSGPGIDTWPDSDVWTWQHDIDAMPDVSWMDGWRRQCADLSAELLTKKK